MALIQSENHAANKEKTARGYQNDTHYNGIGLIEFGSKGLIKKIIIKNAKIDKINVIFLPYYHTKFKYKMEDCWLD